VCAPLFVGRMPRLVFLLAPPGINSHERSHVSAALWVQARERSLDEGNVGG